MEVNQNLEVWRFSSTAKWNAFVIVHGENKNQGGRRLREKGRGREK